MEKRCERPNSAAAFTRKPGVRVSFMQGEADRVAQGHGWQGHIDPRGDHQVGHGLDQLQQVSVIVSVLEQMVEKCTRMNFLVVN